MGMRSWDYLDALAAEQATGPLPVRVRVYLASGLAGEASLDELDARRARLWSLGPAGRRQVLRRRLARAADVRDVRRLRRLRRPAACCSPTRPGSPAGSRRWPLAAGGSPLTPSATAPRRPSWTATSWRSTATGPRWPRPAPRIEHASVLSADLIARMAGLGRDGVHPAVVRGHRRRAAPARPGPGPGRAGLPVYRDGWRPGYRCWPGPTTRSRYSTRWSGWPG